MKREIQGPQVLGRVWDSVPMVFPPLTQTNEVNDMTLFLSYLINGISLGSVYAIIALGYTMVYGIAKMLNFAHGDVIMIGAYVSFCAMQYMAARHSLRRSGDGGLHGAGHRHRRTRL